VTSGYQFDAPGRRKAEAKPKVNKVNNVTKNKKHAVTDQEIIHGLLEHATQEKAAAAMGICTATIRRRSDKPEFQELYLRARSDQRWFLRARAQQAVPAVLQMFVEIMGNKDAKAGDKLRASRGILRHANTCALEHAQLRVDGLQESIEQKEKMCREEDEEDEEDEEHEETEEDLHLAYKSNSRSEVKSTARKGGASSAKINKIVFAMIQHHGNRGKVALECKMSRESLWRWLQKPEVKTLYRKELNAAYLRGLAVMQQAAETAYAFIDRLMKDNNTPASVRIQSGNALLDFARAGFDLDLKERVDDLEARKLLQEPDLSNGSKRGGCRPSSNTME
jgi:hypothetical protein